MDTPHKDPIPQNLIELTSLRAFAAFVVVIFHFYSPHEQQPGLLTNILSDGHLGVDLFFVLSGFILTHVYIKDWLSGGFDYRRFMINRFARLYPLHLVMIVLFLLL